MAADRAEAKSSTNRTVSKFDPFTTSLQGIASEYLIARELGMLFDPTHFSGRGDGHKKDLWRGEGKHGPVTASLKTRGSHLPSDFLFPPKQTPDEFPDDYGIVGRWLNRDYNALEIVGYFSYFDWIDKHETIVLPNTHLKPGDNGVRIGYRGENLRPIEEMIYDLERVPDAKIRAIQDYGYQRYFGHWYRNGGYPVL